MDPSPTAILTSPDWLPHRCDASANRIRFVHMTREEHGSVTFLDDEYLGERQFVDVPIDELLPVAGNHRAPPCYIFHSAFCCSTLLTRAFDLPGSSLGLKEPKILNDLAWEAHQGRLRPHLVELVVKLLGRSAAPDERIVIKPSNEANILIEPLLVCHPEARAVLLSSPLENFLYSIAKKGLWGRAWARRLYLQMRPLQKWDPGFSSAEIFQQTDLQIAAMVWLMHVSQFGEISTKYPDRVRALESSLILEQPANVLSSAASLFGIPLPETKVEQIAESAIFSEHSKETGRSFGREEREAETAALRAIHQDEISMVAVWMEAVAKAIDVQLSTGLPLVEKSRRSEAGRRGG